MIAEPCNDRFARFAIVNSAVLIDRSGLKTVQLAAFCRALKMARTPRTLAQDSPGGRRLRARPSGQADPKAPRLQHEGSWRRVGPRKTTSEALSLIHKRSQCRRGPHGHSSIADLDESARRKPLQHRAYGIA
jgi:hypothetical protein